MTRRLVLIRHAKAGVAETDHDRPLAERGRSDATRLGHWLAEQGLAPDHVLVSTALRTRQTWSAIAAGLATAPEVQFDYRIYENSVDDLLDVLRETPELARTVLLVGHNPAVPLLLDLLDDGTGAPQSARSEPGRFPTSAVAVLTVGGPWSELGAGAGPLTAYTEPGQM